MRDMENVERIPLDSVDRYDAILSALEVHSGNISVRTAKEILSDHKGHVCSHVETVQLGTLWSLIVTLKKPRVHMAEGHPCRTEYKIDTCLNKALRQRRHALRNVESSA
jgi:hypothetical protein